MLAFGGLAQAPLQLRSLNLRGRHFLSGLRIPAFRRRERRLCTVVAEVIVGSDVDDSLKNGVRGKVARDPTVKSIEADLSKIKQDKVSSKTSGRRKRTATKPKASKVDSELDNSTAKAKKKRTATKPVQDETIAPETNKGGERDPVEDQVPGTRKRSTSPARDGTSSRSGKQASENENAVTGTESSTRTRTERKNSSESESLGQLQSSAEDAISIAGAKDDTSRLRSAHACSPNALRLGDGAGQQQEQQAEHQPRPVRAADVDAFSTRNVVAESESTAAQEQEPDGTGAAALGFRALSTKSVEVSELAAFDLRGFGNPATGSAAKVDQVLTGSWTTEGIVKVDEVVTEAEEGSAIVKVDRVLTDVDETSQARPLYLEIQQRRLEEQERRASSPTSKKKKYNIVSEIRFTLDNCSRFGDVIGALEIYNANREAVKFDLYNYNVLLYLCSSAALGVLAPCKQSRQRPDFAESQADAGVEVAEDDAVEEDGVILRGNIAGLSGRNPMGFTQEMMDDFLTKGLEIFEQMQAENVSPNEAALTALARLSVAKRDGDLAFEIVKAMIAAGIPPKLRCYGPAIYVFFKQKNAAKALEVYEHMLAHGVQPEEAELEVLLHLSSVAGLGDRVYSLLHQLRETVRDVSGSTVRVIERWFKSDFAADLGVSSRPGDAMVKRAALERGGGWHGLGWLGRGDWNVEYTTLSGEGICCCCKEKMVTIDITPEDADTFAKCVASLAFKRENNDSFRIFKDWLDKNGPYETVVDGANVGFYNQRFNGELNFAQLNTVVADVHRLSGKWPLVVLHVGRTVKGSGKTPYAQQLLRQWTNANALYVAPTGSNDDWYWLYAAVRCKSLLISNDEMRDHIFQLLGREFFPTWKERHQVRFQVTKQGPMFHMPPPYSIIIQETEKGSWHIPVAGGDDISTPRKWLCVTRRSTNLSTSAQYLSKNQEHSFLVVSKASRSIANSRSRIFNQIQIRNWDTMAGSEVEPLIPDDVSKTEPGDDDEQAEQSPVEEVALTVDTRDDSTLPVETFRMWFLGMLSCIVLSFLNQFFSYRTEPFIIGLISVQIVALPLGKFMASVLPERSYRVPLTGFTFSLNPGPFNVKEHVLVTIFANAGSGFGNGGAYAMGIVNITRAFYKRTMGFTVGLLLVLTTQVLGYGWAGLMKKHLVEPAHMWWPGNLVQVSLFRTLHEQDQQKKGLTRSQFFVIVMTLSFCYYVLPGYMFMMLTSMSWVCWMFPNTVLAQQLGSGLKGLGLGSFSLDWATISAYLGSPLVTPWFAICNVLFGYVIVMYIVTPSCYWNNIYNAKVYPLFSSYLFTKDGQIYDVTSVVDKNFNLDLDAYARKGPIHMSTFFAVSYGLGFAAVASTLTHVACFHGKYIWERSRAALSEKADIHTRLMRKYPDVPQWWFTILLIISVIASIATCTYYKAELQLPWWGVLLACLVASTFTLPIGVITATTNITPGLNIITEYLMGYLLPGQPMANVCFKTYGYISMTQAISFLQDFKLGHYMKVPPRSMFHVQFIGTLIAGVVNMCCAWWLLGSIQNICDKTLLPPNSPWTCPSDRVFFDASVIWGLIGPARMFGSQGEYKELQWFFLGGALGPILVWLATKAFPNTKWIPLINLPVILGSTAYMPPATSVNYISWGIMGIIFNFFLFRYRKRWWQRYNYVFSAAMDAGVAFMGVLLYLCLGLENRNLNWWGNNPDNCPLADCPTAKGVVVDGCPVY